MIADMHPNSGPLMPALHRLIHRHGASAVVWALVRTLLMPRKRRPRPPDPYHLSPHMRRDIGLPPDPPRAALYYELR